MEKNRILKTIKVNFQEINSPRTIKMINAIKTIVIAPLACGGKLFQNSLITFRFYYVDNVFVNIGVSVDCCA
jgi:hypothetical protein